MLSKSLLAAAFIATSVVSTLGACHNGCSGHGTCGAYDICTCHTGWDVSTAHDCSERRCPYGKTRGSTHSDGVHSYQECSDNGVCNRQSGECECHEGYTGASCQRAMCPSDCNGRGNCQPVGTHVSAYTSTNWDSKLTMVCKCDPGFEGPACERRMCPVGDDPLTLSQTDNKQTCTISAVGNAALTGKFTLKFTDWTGQVHETRAHDITTVTSLSLKESLLALPNNVVPAATVTVSGDPSSAPLVMVIEFTSSDNSGTLPLMTIESDDDSAQGHQPVRAKLSSAGDVAITATCVETVAGTAESKVCAGRGVCDSEAGKCVCHSGFYGHSCDKQTSLQ